MIGASIFALCLWLRFEPGIGEFLEKLDAEEFYIGVYVLIVASIIIMIVAFIGCISALQESSIVLLVVSTIIQVLRKLTLAKNRSAIRFLSLYFVSSCNKSG
jgi:type III secretory pathway component EscS